MTPDTLNERDADEDRNDSSDRTAIAVTACPVWNAV